MERNISQLTQTQKGILYFLGGMFLLLYALNIIGKTLNFVVILVSLAIIAYGLFVAEIPQKVLALLNRLNKK